MSTFDGLGGPILLKRLKGRVLYGNKRMDKCSFRATLGILDVMFVHKKNFPYLYLDLACEQ